ncbi:MAG TPA: phage holin family protein [Rhizomicrobium sp.]|nr:phage holin family protein [Rhizomicrobium sp.]
MDQYRSLGAVVTDLLHEGRDLFRSEVALARAEMAEKAARMKSGIIAAAIAAAFLIASLVLFLQAAVGGLMAAGLTLWLSSLIVGAAALVIGAILLSLGLARLKARTLIPTRTARQLRRDAALSREVHA